MHCYTSFTYGDSNGGTAWCGSHTEPAVDPHQGRPYPATFGDDRVGCSAIWGWTTSNGYGSFSGARGDVTADNDFNSETVCLDRNCHGTVKNYYDLYGCEGDSGSKVGARCCSLPDAEDGGIWFGSCNPDYVSCGSENTAKYHELELYSTYDYANRCNSIAEYIKFDQITLGCTASGSRDGEYGGTKQVGNKCQTQQQSISRIDARAIVGKVTGGEIGCSQVYSKSSTLETKDVYVSEIQCPTGTTMTDCNGYMDQQIDFCDIPYCKSKDNVLLRNLDFIFLVGEWELQGQHAGYPYYKFKAITGTYSTYYMFVFNGEYYITRTLGNIGDIEAKCTTNDIRACIEGKWSVLYSFSGYRNDGDAKITTCDHVQPTGYNVFGEIFDGDKCVASGNSHQIRSQANCCKVTFP